MYVHYDNSQLYTYPRIATEISTLPNFCAMNKSLDSLSTKNNYFYTCSYQQLSNSLQSFMHYSPLLL